MFVNIFRLSQQLLTYIRNLTFNNSLPNLTTKVDSLLKLSKTRTAYVSTCWHESKTRQKIHICKQGYSLSMHLLTHSKNNGSYFWAVGMGNELDISISPADFRGNWSLAEMLRCSCINRSPSNRSTFYQTLNHNIKKTVYEKMNTLTSKKNIYKENYNLHHHIRSIYKWRTSHVVANKWNTPALCLVNVLDRLLGFSTAKKSKTRWKDITSFQRFQPQATHCSQYCAVYWQLIYYWLPLQKLQNFIHCSVSIVLAKVLNNFQREWKAVSSHKA